MIQARCGVSRAVPTSMYSTFSDAMSGGVAIGIVQRNLFGGGGRGGGGLRRNDTMAPVN